MFCEFNEWKKWLSNLGKWKLEKRYEKHIKNIQGPSFPYEIEDFNV